MLGPGLLSYFGDQANKTLGCCSEFIGIETGLDPGQSERSCQGDQHHDNDQLKKGKAPLVGPGAHLLPYGKE